MQSVGNHVEADTRADDDAGSDRLVVPALRGDEDVDFAGDVDVMRAREEAGVEHRGARDRERAGAMRDHRHAVERAPRRGNVGQRKDARGQSELRRECGRFIASSGQDRR